MYFLQSFAFSRSLQRTPLMFPPPSPAPTPSPAPSPPSLFPLAATHSSHVPATLSRSDTLSRSVTAKPFPAPQPSPAPSPEFLYKIHSLIRRFAVLPCNCIPFPILRQSSRHLYVENRLCLQIHCLISSIFYCFICLYLL